METTASPLVLTPIGRIRTPHRSLETCPRHGGDDQPPSVLELLPEYADALLGIEAASHLYIMYWLDQADRTTLLRKTPHDGVVRGVFAVRSPVRPNPLGLSVTRLISRNGTALTVGGLDCLDGTPLIDIKPYLPLYDRIEAASLAWFKT